MGVVASKAFGGVGSAIGSAFLAPIKSIFDRSCDDVCFGTWDLICFLEHLCISSVLRLFMVAVLVYIIIYFLYLLCQLGILHFIGRSLFRMSWAAWKTYWKAMAEISCFLLHKLKHMKRIDCHRFEDMEEAFSSTDNDDGDDDCRRVVRRRRSVRERRKNHMWRSLHPVSSTDDDDSDDDSRRVIRRRRSVRERRKNHMRRSLHPVRHSSKGRRSWSRSRHHVRLRTRSVSVHVKGSGRIRKSRQMHLRKASHHFGHHHSRKHRTRQDEY